MPASPAPWPAELLANAWSAGEPVTGPVDDALVRWTFQPRGARAPKMLKPERPADLADWTHPDVGWGLILPEVEGLSDADAARATDAPEPIRTLLESRPGSPVLRYRPQSRFTHLVRHDSPDQARNVVLSGPERGTGPGALPRYLLIYGAPDVIPWELQYLLNQTAAVGRLTLTGRPLERYVDALMSGWREADSRTDATTTWAVSTDRMSRLMRDVVAQPVHEAFASDCDLASDAVFIDGDGANASVDELIASVARQRPAVIVTTSHGYVTSAGDAAAAPSTLGLPVGQDGRPLALDQLLDAWQPDGAVWYAHACCSAGTDRQTIFDGVFPEGSSLDTTLQEIASLGTLCAPLPEALLGAERPLRAFIGHVEPTFDWTIRNRTTGDALTASIRDALYTRLYQPWPVGYAFEPCYQHAGELFAARDLAYKAFNRGEDTRDVALAAQLGALDRQSMVILGDPTVTLAPLH